MAAAPRRPAPSRDRARQLLLLPKPKGLPHVGEDAPGDAGARVACPRTLGSVPHISQRPAVRRCARGRPTSRRERPSARAGALDRSVGPSRAEERTRRGRCPGDLLGKLSEALSPLSRRGAPGSQPRAPGGRGVRRWPPPRGPSGGEEDACSGHALCAQRAPRPSCRARCWPARDLQWGGPKRGVPDREPRIS